METITYITESGARVERQVETETAKYLAKACERRGLRYVVQTESGSILEASIDHPEPVGGWYPKGA